MAFSPSSVEEHIFCGRIMSEAAAFISFDGQMRIVHARFRTNDTCARASV
jgi:hypothetical protein